MIVEEWTGEVARMPGGALQSCRLLVGVVDDDGGHALGKRLERVTGDARVVVETSLVAVEQALARSVNVAVLDVRLGEDALVFGSRLQREHGVPVVYVGSSVELALLQRGATTHPAACLLEPFSDAQLLLTLEAACRTATAESEELPFQQLLEATPDPILIVGADGRIVGASGEAESLFEYSHAELVGMNVDRLLPESAPPNHAQLRDRYLRDPSVRNLAAGRELFTRTKSGTQVPVQIRLRAVDVGDRRLVVCSVRDVKEWKQAREVARVSRERLSVIFENTREYISLLRRAGPGKYTIEAMSPSLVAAHQEYVGDLRVEDVLGLDVGEFMQRYVGLDARRIAAARELYDGLVLRGETLCHEEVIQLPNSRQVVTDSSLVPVRNADGDVEWLLWVGRDVTEMKRVEAALRESEARWQFALEGSGQGVWDWDLTTGAVFLSARWREALGYARDELDDDFETWTSVVHPADLEAMRQRLQAHIDGETDAFESEHRMRCKDGSYRWFKGRGKAVERDEQGRARRIVGVQSDVSETRAMLQALTESESRFRTLIESLDVGVLLQDVNDHIVLSNPAARRILGGPQFTLEGISSSDERWTPIREDGQPLSIDEVPSVVAARTLRPVRNRLLGTRNLETGKRIWLLVSAVPRLRDDGQLQHTLSTIVDVTAQRALEEQLVHGQKLQAVGALAGGIAHDFNNILTVINGCCDLMLWDDVPEGHELRQDLEEIREAGERAAWLTEQLLLFSRKAHVQPSTFDLNELIRGLKQMLRRTIEERVVVRMITAHDRTPVEADRARIEQAIVNLCLNARDAMPDGGQLTIETRIEHSPASADRAGPWACIAVRDTGCGMTAAVRERIFEPFYTTKDVGKGTGLGLATAYGVVKQSGGWIDVDSELGSGTEFRIYLPLAVEPGKRAASPRTSHPTKEVSGTVLLIEDESSVRWMERRALEKAGLRVIEAANGIEGLERYEEESGLIDLVITDLVMPRMGGRAVAAKLRGRSPELPILFVTGHDRELQSSDSQALASEQLLEKPFEVSELIERVARLLDA